jgi:hypothetical protein
MTATEKQVLITVAVAFIFWRIKPAAELASDTPSQIWAGAGTDPFGVSYTVSERVARGGL